MKQYIRILSLSLALVLMLGLFAACSKSGSNSESTSDAQSGASTSHSDVSAPEQGDASAPDASQVEEESETPAPEAKPEEKPQSKPQSPGSQVDELPALPLPEAKPEQSAPEVKPEEKPAGVDLDAFYQTIFTDPANSPMMEAFSVEALDAFYPGLTSIQANQCVAYMASITAVPCEIIMMECANAADADTVKSIFQSRIDAQVNDHMNYPMVIEAWENEAKVVTNGNYVALFVVSGMTDQVVSNFNALF